MYNRAKVVDIARQQIGVAEPKGDDKYIRWYNSVERTSFADNVSWCFIFVSWVLRMSGIPESVMPNFASCGVGMKWAKLKGRWKKRSYSPLPGDLIFFDWNGANAPAHVGLVVKTDSDYVYTIEGNSSNMVSERKYKLNHKSIFGYIAIPYDDAVLETPVVPTKMRIVEIQNILRDKFGAKIVADNIWGPKSQAALILAIQKTLNDAYRTWLALDGVWGPKTQSGWRNVSIGMTGDFVLLVQIALIAKRYDIDPDGIFGSDTLAAVNDFQRKNSLEEDGIVGRLTISKLIK